MNVIHRRIVGGVCSLVFIVACASQAEKRPSNVAAAFDRFDRYQSDVARTDATAAAAGASVSNRYDTLFAPYQTRPAVEKLGDSDVALLFRAADATFAASDGPRALRDMELDLAELRRRGTAHDFQYREVHAALIHDRAFARALDFAKQNALPAIRYGSRVKAGDRAAPTMLLVEDGGNRLEREAVDLTKPRVVVIASPLCHFCQRAIRSIENDAVLRPVFRTHALWLVPPDGTTPFEVVAKWNRRHQHEPMQVAYRREEWPMVRRWETPAFYFFRAGRVVGTITGWPVAGRRAEIVRLLRSAGMI